MKKLLVLIVCCCWEAGISNNRDIKFRTFAGEKTPAKAAFLQTLKIGKRKWNTNKGGKEIITPKTEIEIDGSNFSKGIYFIEIQIENKTIIKKLIIN